MTTSALEPTELAPLADLMPHRHPWALLVLLACLLAAGSAYAWHKTHATTAAPPFVTAPVRRGDVAETIEATGSLQPTLQVQVGAQISGRISALHADFNSVVHRGDLLAEIDPAPMEAALSQQTAAVRSAQANLARARATSTLQQQALTRAQDLRDRGLNAVADLESARAARDEARAAVTAAEAQLAQANAARTSAQTNLSYTRIYAPIDGVVISRSVDVGQTVAASLQAPVLFVIANDLTHMQVAANVDESDVGHIEAGQHVVARVDAFPNQTFEGTVRELRYGATTTSGVVTYPAIVDVANPDLRLRPGMTATVTVVTRAHPNVLRVPNAALRFRPAADVPVTQAASSARADAPGSARAANDDTSRGRLYVLRNGEVMAANVRVGLSDGAYTEVSGEGLDEQTQVIVDQQTTAAGANSAPRAGTGNPLGGARPAGGRGAGAGRRAQ